MEVVSWSKPNIYDCKLFFDFHLLCKGVLGFFVLSWLGFGVVSGVLVWFVFFRWEERMNNTEAE